MTKTNWKEEAAKIGSLGMPFARLLKSHLLRWFPALVKQLEATGDLEAYTVVMGYRALDKQATMVEQGTDYLIAHELAMAELLPTPPDEDQDDGDEATKETLLAQGVSL